MDNVKLTNINQVSQSEKSQTTKTQTNTTVKTSAPLNYGATALFLQKLGSQQDNMPENLQKIHRFLSNSLNTYIQDKENIPKEVSNSNSNNNHYTKLAMQVIGRDSKLQEKVAQNLSSAKRLIRSRDAQASFEKIMNNLPASLREDTEAGKNLSKFICQILVDLTEKANIGAGLERDLSIKEIYLRQKELSSRAKATTNEVLAMSLNYVESNQKEVLSTIDEAAPMPKTSNTTAATMTRYLRKALNEFPEDSTYLDIFKQNKDKDAEFEDKVSLQISNRVKELISKAADTARRANLIPNPNDKLNTANANTIDAIATKRQHMPSDLNTTQRALDTDVSAKDLSLSELSARAAQLQMQFREERHKLAQEGKLPNPAPMPQIQDIEIISNKANKLASIDNSINSAKEGLISMHKDPLIKEENYINKISNNTNEQTTIKASSITEQEITNINNTRTNDKSLSSVNELYKSNVKLSFNALVDPDFGSLSKVPGQTINVANFERATQVVDQSQMEKIQNPQSLDKALSENKKLQALYEQQDRLKREEQEREALISKQKLQNIFDKLQSADQSIKNLSPITQNTEQQVNVQVAANTNTASENSTTVVSDKVQAQEAKPKDNIQKLYANVKHEAVEKEPQIATTQPKEEKVIPSTKEQITNQKTETSTTQKVASTMDESYFIRSHNFNTVAKQPIPATYQFIIRNVVNDSATADNIAKAQSKPQAINDNIKTTKLSNEAEAEAEVKAEIKTLLKTEPQVVNKEPKSAINKDNTNSAVIDDIVIKNNNDKTLTNEKAINKTVKESTTTNTATTINNTKAEAEVEAEIKTLLKTETQTQVAKDKASNIANDEIAVKEPVKPATSNDKAITATKSDNKANTDAEISTNVKTETQAQVTKDKASNIVNDEIAVKEPVKPATSNDKAITATKSDNKANTDAEISTNVKAETQAQVAKDKASNIVNDEIAVKEPVKPTTSNDKAITATKSDNKANTDAEISTNVKAETQAQVAKDKASNIANDEIAVKEPVKPTTSNDKAITATKSDNKANTDAEVSTNVKAETQAQTSKDKASSIADDIIVEEPVKPTTSNDKAITVTKSDNKANTDAEVSTNVKAETQAQTSKDKASNIANDEIAVEEPVKPAASNDKTATTAKADSDTNTDAEASTNMKTETQTTEDKISNSIANDEVAVEESIETTVNDDNIVTTNNTKVQSDVKTEVETTVVTNPTSNVNTTLTDSAQIKPTNTENTNKLQQLYTNITTNTTNTEPNSTTNTIVNDILANTIPKDDLVDIDNEIMALQKNEKIEPKLNLNNVINLEEINEQEALETSQLATNKDNQFKLENVDNNELIIQDKIVNQAVGASSIGNGENQPIPDLTVVSDKKAPKEPSFLKKLMSVFTAKKEEAKAMDIPTGEVTSSQIKESIDFAKLSNNMRQNPLNNLMSQLATVSTSNAMPDEVKKQALKFMEAMLNPIDDLKTVNQWLNFATNPMSPNSTQAVALHQWAFLLLCIRFNQLGKSAQKFLDKNKLELKDSSIKFVDSMSDDAKTKCKDLLDESMSQIERLQQLKQNTDVNQIIPRYIPLPPSYEGGREGGLNFKQEVEEDGSKSYTLSFYFDIKDLGPMEIKANSKFPELQISVVTETLAGLQKVQEYMPTLVAKLQDFGITTKATNARLGRISMPSVNSDNTKHNKATDDKSTLNIDI